MNESEIIKKKKKNINLEFYYDNYLVVIIIYKNHQYLIKYLLSVTLNLNLKLQRQTSVILVFFYTAIC